LPAVALERLEDDVALGLLQAVLQGRPWRDRGGAGGGGRGGSAGGRDGRPGRQDAAHVLVRDRLSGRRQGQALGEISQLADVPRVVVLPEEGERLVREPGGPGRPLAAGLLQEAGGQRGDVVPPLAQRGDGD